MRICNVARRAGIPVVIGTLAVAIVAEAIEPHAWPPMAHVEHSAGTAMPPIDAFPPIWAYGSNSGTGIPYDWT